MIADPRQVNSEGVPVKVITVTGGDDGETELAEWIEANGPPMPRRKPKPRPTGRQGTKSKWKHAAPLLSRPHSYVASGEVTFRRGKRRSGFVYSR